MLLKQRFGLILVALSAIFFGPSANAQQISIKKSIEASYQRDSREAKEIQRWLTQHAEYRNGQMLGDLSKLGTISVRIVSSNVRGSAGVESVGGDPPVPLPASGNSGDTITVSSCSGGASQTWSYVWVGNSISGSWQLTSYTYIRTKSCSSGST